MRIVLLGLLPLLAAADWPQFLGPQRDGSSPETGLLHAFPEGGPKILWSIPAEQGLAGPAVVGDRLIFFHRIGDEEVVECLDPATGKQRWKSAYPTGYRDMLGKDEGPRATPLIAGERIYTLGAAGQLRAWELATGKEIWKHNLLKEYDVPPSFFGVGTSPLLVNERLLVQVGAKGASVVAFDAATGKELWKAGNDAASYSSPVLAKIGKEEDAIFFTRSGLLMVKPDDGTIRATYPWKPRTSTSVSAATPVVRGDRIFLSAEYGAGAVLLQVEGDKVKELWSSNKTLSCHYNTPLLIGAYLYGVDGRSDFKSGKLRCVAFETGKLAWTEENFGVASLLHADGLLIALTEEGELVLIDPSPEKYKELARAKLFEGETRALPALANGRLFARDTKKLIAVMLAK